MGTHVIAPVDGGVVRAGDAVAVAGASTDGQGCLETDQVANTLINGIRHGEVPVWLATDRNTEGRKVLSNSFSRYPWAKSEKFKP